VPPGPAGNMGFRILWATQQIVPWGNDSWLICDNETIAWESDTAMTITGLVIEGYNLGNFPHTIFLRGLVANLTPQQQQEVTELTGPTALPGSQVEGESDLSGSLTSGLPALPPVETTGPIPVIPSEPTTPPPVTVTGTPIPAPEPAKPPVKKGLKPHVKITPGKPPIHAVHIAGGASKPKPGKTNVKAK
jgi:hypothetical protein